MYGNFFVRALHSNFLCGKNTNIFFVCDFLCVRIHSNFFVWEKTLVIFLRGLHNIFLCV